ncbi:hypothetical protein [Aquipuribacter sp. SD81]|uniref:hypothetical protein n=1 Tax=Aquipuribacter sp. SD81 TaxID=3127703 RepID=UPI00301845BC
MTTTTEPATSSTSRRRTQRRPVNPTELRAALDFHGQDPTLRTFYAQTDTPVADALAGVGDYQAAAAALVALGPRQPGLGAGGVDPVVVASDEVVQEAIASGRPVDVEALVSAARAKIAEYEARTAVVAAVTRQRSTLSSAVGQALRDAIESGVLFGYVDAQLTDVLERVSEATRSLAGVSDAEAAISHGKVEQWQHLARLHEEYRRVRVSGQQLYKAADTTGADLRQATLYLGDPLAAWPDLVAHRYGLKVEDADGTVRPARPAPWPEDWLSLEAMLWQAQHPEALPRVATPAQVQATNGAVEQYARDANTHRSRAGARHWREEFANPEDPGAPQRLARSLEARAAAWRERFHSHR